MVKFMYGMFITLITYYYGNIPRNVQDKKINKLS